MALVRTGAEELRRIVNVLDRTNEGALDPYTAEQLIRIVRAIWGQPWDIYPDQLTRDELDHAAEYGTVSVETLTRLERLYA